MKNIYLDNAATTAVRQEVIEVMMLSLQQDFGNPSSTHSLGRQGKSAIELARKSIAKILNCNAQEIIFTGSATEANNLILRNAVVNLGVKRVITSRIEHHAVLHTLQDLQKEANFEIEYVSIKESGEIDITGLTDLLSDSKPTLVSLMHVNNEIGVKLNLAYVAKLIKQYGALFHSDAVQSVGKYAIDLNEIQLDFLVASAHKFNGPKGVGFAFVRKGSGIKPIILGGEQEKGLRAGTESTHNIVGMATALQITINQRSIERPYIEKLKKYAILKLVDNFPGIKINGNSENSSNHILNVCLPFAESKSSMILFHLDLKGIAVSRGSACQSGSQKGSHVLAEILSDDDFRKPSIRISFSYQNTESDIDALVLALKQI